MYDRKNREKMGRLSDEMNALTGKAKTQNRGLTGEEREKWLRLESEYAATEDAVKINERTDGISAAMSAADGHGPVIGLDLEEARDSFRLTASGRRERMRNDPHSKAFSSYLRAGERLGDSETSILRGASAALAPEIRNTMATTSGTQGGYVIPAGFSGMLEVAKQWFGGIAGTVDRFETSSGNPFPWPTTNDTANKGRIIGQNAQVVQTDLQFGQVNFGSYIGSSDLVLVPLALLEDSFFDLDALIARLLGMRIGRLYNQKCTVGTGSGEPTGIVTAAVAAGNVLTLTTGSAASIAYGNLVDLEHSVDPAYRENPSSRWMFSDATLKLLKKLVDGNNRPLWQPGLTASFQDGAAVVNGSKPRILDHEYVINNDMAAAAASAYSVLFGDLSTFKVREVTGGTTVLVLRERYADNLQVGYIAYQRFDSNLVDAGTHPIAVLQQSAS